jgi:hypothetical protein
MASVDMDYVQFWQLTTNLLFNKKQTASLQRDCRFDVATSPHSQPTPQQTDAHQMLERDSQSNPAIAAARCAQHEFGYQHEEDAKGAQGMIREFVVM